VCGTAAAVDPGGAKINKSTTQQINKFPHSGRAGITEQSGGQAGRYFVHFL
jgi:hypothetical protein